MRYNTPGRLALILIVTGFIHLMIPHTTSHAGETAQWLNPVSGNWDNPVMWSTPSDPHNGSPNFDDQYDVVIDALSESPSSTYTITGPNNSTGLDSFLLNSPNARLILNTGLLLSSNGFDLARGTMLLTGGFLEGGILTNSIDIQNATLESRAGGLRNLNIQIQYGNLLMHGGLMKNVTIGGSGEGGSVEIGPATLENVVLDAGVDYSVKGTVMVPDDLVLNGQIEMAYNTVSQAFHFTNAAPSITGAGTLLANGYFTPYTLGQGNAITSSQGPLTLGPDITTRVIDRGWISFGQTGAPIINHGTMTAEGTLSGLVLGGEHWENHGQIRVTNDATLRLHVNENNWLNTGSIEITDSTLQLTGRFALSDLASIAQTNVKTEIWGTLVDGVLNATTGSFDLVNGTVAGTAFTTNDGTSLTVKGDTGVFDGASVDGHVVVEPGAEAQFINGASLNGLVSMRGDRLQRSYLNVIANPLTGSGTIQFESHQDVQDHVTAPEIESGITIQSINGGTGRIFADTLRGQILAESEGGEIILHGGVNEGVIRVSNGARVVGIHQNDGSGLTNNNRIEVLAGGTLNLTADWSNQGTIILTEGILELGGEMGDFVIADLGTIQRTGGEIYLAGELTNEGQAFVLDASTGGSWNLGGYTNRTLGWSIRGGTIPVPASGFDVNILGDGSFNNVIVERDWHIPANTELATTTGFTLNGDMSVVGNLRLNGDLEVDGAGRFIFNGDDSNGSIHYSLDVPTMSSTLTVQTGTQGGAFGLRTNHSLILAQTPGKTIEIEPSYSSHVFTNLGTLHARNQSSIIVKRLNGNLGSIIVETGGLIDLDGTYTLDQPVSLNDDSTLTLRGAWTNQAALTVDGANLNLLAPGENNGTILINNANLELGGDITGAGSTDIQNSNVNLTGALTTAKVEAMGLISGANNVVIQPGSLIDNDAGILDFQNATATWTLNGGTIQGGSIESTTPPLNATGDSLIRDATLNLDLNVLSDTTTLDGVAINSTVQLSPGSQLLLTGDWTNNGAINGEGATLTISAMPTSPPIGFETIVLQYSTINLATTLTTRQVETLPLTSNMLAVTRGGLIDNTGDVLSLNTTPEGLVMTGGTILGGVIEPGDGNATLEATEYLTRLNGVTLNADLNIQPGASLLLEGDWQKNATITGHQARLFLGGEFTYPEIGPTALTESSIMLVGTLNNTGQVFTPGDDHWRLGNSSYPLSGSGVIVGGEVANGEGTGNFFINGNTTFRDTLISADIITNRNSANVTLEGNWSLTGSITLTPPPPGYSYNQRPSTIRVSGNYDGASLNGIHMSGAFSGTVNNTDNTMQLNNSWRVEDAYITGGSITSTFDQPLLAGGGVTLDGVTLDIDVAPDGYSYVRTFQIDVRNGLTLKENRTINFNEYTSLLTFVGDQTLDGQGTLLFDWRYNHSHGLRLAPLAGQDSSTLTIGSGITMRNKSSISTVQSVSPGVFTLINEGVMIVEGGGFDIDTRFINRGLIDTAQSGILRVDQFEHAEGGRLQGAGSVNGNVQQTGGVVAPGLSPGTLTINGDYTQEAGTLEIEIGGTDPGAFDILQVNGHVSLAGGLDITLLDDFLPTLGQSWTILQSTSTITGHFTSVTGWRTPNNLTLVPNYIDDHIDLIAAIPADFNFDKQVDVQDLSIWATSFGATDALYQNGDANLNGQVDVSDLSVWATYFGSSAADFAPPLLTTLNSATAIPEPSTFTLIGLSILSMVRRKRRRD